MHDVGTFDILDAIEIRANGLRAAGIDGFNVPSLLGLRFSAPYLHNGRAQSLDDVLALHTLTIGEITQPIVNVLSNDSSGKLKVFLRSIDAHTPTMDSETDVFCKDLKICENK